MSSQRGFASRGGKGGDWNAGMDDGFEQDSFGRRDDRRGGFNDERDSRQFARPERGGVRFGDDDGEGYEDERGYATSRGDSRSYGNDRFESRNERAPPRDRYDTDSNRRQPDSAAFISVECAGQEGRIIGKGGEKIREIQERTGAHLSVRKELGVVEVEGGDVHAAEQEIRRLVEDGRRSDSTRGYSASERETRESQRSSQRDEYGDEYGRDDGYGGSRGHRDDSYYDDDSDDDWVLEGLEDELADARNWSGEAGGENDAGRYRPEAMAKYVDDDFEPMVYTREPDDADEYNFFAGSRFRQFGANEEVDAALQEMGIERPSHIQALTYKALNAEFVLDNAREGGEMSEASSEESDAPETPSTASLDSESYVPSQNILLADQAGSGKTLAYLLPLLQRLQKVEAENGRAKPNKPRLLILCPTSELVMQVLGVVRQLARGGLRCRSLAMTGGNQGKTQTQALKEGIDVVVGTPGRVSHLLDVGKIDVSELEAVVMDECDVLLGDSFEFAEQVRPLREATLAVTNSTTRFVLVTATIPEDVLRQLREFFDGDLRVVQGPGLHRPAAGLLERLVDCSGGDVVDDQSGFYRKYRALEQLLEAEREKGQGKKGKGGAARRMLLFCNKIETCRRVENMLRRADKHGERLVPVPYHAALTDERRKQSLEEFLQPPRPGETPMMLVCTDRASRGLDASLVSHVILFDFPRDPSEYVRRVGRTARGALGTGEVSVLVLGRQVRLAREIMRRNTRGDPVESTPQF